jgi:hypothetical protein
MNWKRVHISTRQFDPIVQRSAKHSPHLVGGTASPRIGGPPLTPAAARQLGAALIAAADEAEQMAGYDQDHDVMA